MVNLDLTNNKTLTILVIVCILAFACVYVMVIRDGKTEGFADFPLASGDTVRLVDGLQAVKLGRTGNQNVFPLASGDTVRLVDGLQAVKLGSTGNQNVNDIINTLVPPLTVVAYADKIAPSGWQICNGDFLKTISGRTLTVKTPDLRGRTIIGINPLANSGISTRALNESGGAETHTLTVSEMPPHSHNYNVGPNNCTGGNCPYFGTGGNSNNQQNTLSTGDGIPHNNMQPFFVLNYIIKQPIQ